MRYLIRLVISDTDARLIAAAYTNIAFSAPKVSGTYLLYSYISYQMAMPAAIIMNMLVLDIFLYGFKFVIYDEVTTNFDF